MPLKIQSNIDYEQVCNELGITMETLMSLTSAYTTQKNSSKVTFLKVADDFIENLTLQVKNKKRSKTTLVTYLNFINRIKEYVNKIDPNLALDQFNELLLLKFYSTLKSRRRTNSQTNEEKEVDKTENDEKEKLSDYTMNKYTAIIRKLFKYAYIVEYVDKDLSVRFDFNKTKLLPRYFNNEQVKSILKQAYRRTYGYRWYSMIYFMLLTGCRISETTNIKIKDIHFDNDIIFVKGKGNKTRIITLYPETKKHLISYLDDTGLTNKENCNGFLFSRDEDNVRKKRISNRSLQYQISNIFKDANINESYFTTHSFRHTFAVNCLKAGMEIQFLSQLLGHTNPATTSIYTQLLPIDLKEQVMKNYPFPMEALLKEIL